MTELLYHEARSRALVRELEDNPELTLIGGAVALPFNPDDGLAERYGERIVWPPISEFANIGLAAGAAINGMRVLVPITTSSFMFYGWAPLVLEAANVRYLSGGAATAPLAVHVMAGSRRGGAAQHEHTPQSMLHSVPGLRVIAPGTPAGVDAAFHAALTGPDPTVIVDNVRLAPFAGEVGERPAEVGSTLVREGTDALIVSYSLMLQHALAAARALESEGASVAVLDLALLNPLPVAAALERIAEHRLVLFADEARAPGSPASHLMARMLEAGIAARAKLVCSAGAPSPFAPELVDEVVPTAATVEAALRELLAAPARGGAA
ncbi:MAG TPA: transketolase C-terminal domain-containing protein [Solirubrobacteraceae bacterium]|nr:transketolase C-terminal domain-containing protein [Solirubrobacteraceae bacterium]